MQTINEWFSLDQKSHYGPNFIEMLIFQKEKLVLLSVPKTGTTALQSALGLRADIVVRDPPELKHAPLYRYHRFFKPMVDKFCNGPFETLAVIREPLDWAASWYRYRSRPFLNGRDNSTANISFPDFILGYLAVEKPAFAKIGSQSKFVAQKDGSPGVDHLFAYEEQGHLLGFLEDRLQCEISLPKLNISPRRDLSLDENIRKRFEQECAAEYALWESSRRGG